MHGHRKKSAETDVQHLARDVREIRSLLAASQSMNNRLFELAVTFLKGILYAIGAMVAVAIIVPVMLWFLRGVEWPPIVGGFVTKVIHQIERASPPSPPAAVDQ